MALVCDNCKYEGSRADFKFLSHADSAGPNTYRQCPKCHVAIYCEELDVIDDNHGECAWGTGKLRGQVFRRKKGTDNVK